MRQPKPSLSLLVSDPKERYQESCMFSRPASQRFGVGIDLFALSLVFWLSLAAPPAGAQFGPVVLNSASYRWDIGTEEFNYGAIIDGTSDAYDTCYLLEVDGVSYAPSDPYTFSPDGRTVIFPEWLSPSGLVVQRLIYVPDSGGDWARFLDIFSNRGAAAIEATVRIHGNLGSDGSTRLIATSSGDFSLDPSDGWFVTDDVDGSLDPSLGHVVQGLPATSPLFPITQISLIGDNISFEYEISVPPGEQVAILTFAIQAPNQATAQAEAARLVNLPDEALVGIEEYLDVIGNFYTLGSREACRGVAEGGACVTRRGEQGRCLGGRCCTGCWNGTRCLAGRSPSACGRGGVECRSCIDRDPCTSDICTDSGSCTNPFAPAGTICDDGLFCTAIDRCDGMGRCVGTGARCDDGLACTTDRCDESTRRCIHEPPSNECLIARRCVARGTSPPGRSCLVCDPERNRFAWSVSGDGCAIGGECIPRGTRHPGEPCLVCDPDRNPTDWSPARVGEPCGENRCTGGVLLLAPTCNASGLCIPSGSMRCTSGSCASPSACASTCTATSCPEGFFCGPSGACEPLRTNGSSCSRNEECRSSFCVDGFCCESRCNFPCHSCGLEGREGRCVAAPMGSDPRRECRGSACDGMGRCIAMDAGILQDASMPSDTSPDAPHRTDATLPGSEAGMGKRGCICTLHQRASMRPLHLYLFLLMGLVARRRLFR
ncbi:MAG: hypothetical protein NZM37_11710 [Sandaracinaceae bacterium]|nr:hypothetical protein [Sandaracinaceae bacterium]